MAGSSSCGQGFGSIGDLFDKDRRSARVADRKGERIVENGLECGELNRAVGVQRLLGDKLADREIFATASGRETPRP